jgi:copper resistance protein B
MKIPVLLTVILMASTVPALAQDHAMGGAATEAAPFGPPIADQHVWYHLIANRLEGRFGSESAFRWNAEAWAGTDSNRVWLKTEGLVSSNGAVENGRLELLYDRPITSFFNAQLGLRTDLDSGPGRNWAALGVEGLAPQFFHLAATGYVSDQGRLAARFEGSYDLLLTQQLVLQPLVELNFYSRPDPARLLGSGLAELEAGLRLRYEISRKFAPYIGLTYENKFGGTAGYARLAGEPTAKLQLTTGLRLWY